MSITLLLILFNSFISALFDNLNPKSILSTEEMTESKIFTINITKGKNESIQLYNGNNYKKAYISIVLLNGKNIKVNSNKLDILNETKDLNGYQLIEYNPSIYIDYIYIYLASTSDEAAQVEVTNSLLNDFPIYQTIFVNGNKVNKNNFVFFLNETKNKYELTINFNNNENEKDKEKPKLCYYQMVRLPIKDSNYTLPASYYNNENKNCNFDKLSFNYKNVTDNNSTKKEIAFIFSIKDNKKFEYIVTITKLDEAMTIFLYVSIGLAGVFAVITFFLIRRKQSIDTKNDDNQEDLYNNEENKEE